MFRTGMPAVYHVQDNNARPGNSSLAPRSSGDPSHLGPAWDPPLRTTHTRQVVRASHAESGSDERGCIEDGGRLPHRTAP
jgi:hypothetical protein